MSEPQMGMADWVLALSELPVQDVFQDATIFHSIKVARPVQSVLSQERVLAEEIPRILQMQSGICGAFSLAASR